MTGRYFVQVVIPALGDGRFQIIERTIIHPTFHGGPRELVQDLIIPPEHMQCSLRKVEHLIVGLHLHIGKVWTDRHGDIAGQRPRRRRPHEKGFALASAQREAQRNSRMGHFDVAVSYNLMLADAGRAARAPGHYVRAAINPTVLPTFLQKGPNHVVILI